MSSIDVERSHDFARLITTLSSKIREMEITINNLTTGVNNISGGVSAGITGGSFSDTAFHKDIAAEISALTRKSTPAGTDYMLMEDQAASSVKKYTLLSDIITALVPGADTDAIHDNVNAEFSAMNVLASLAAADKFIVEDASHSHDKHYVPFSTLENDLNHDALSGFAPGEHFVMLDQDDMADDDAGKAATQQSIKAFADELELYGIASYVHTVGAAQVYSHQTGNSESVSNVGVTTAATGTPYLWFALFPPDWMVKYAEAKSKTITLVTTDCHWQDNNAADFITHVLIYHRPFDAHTGATIYDNLANLGIGTTGLRQDTFDMTNQALDKGDGFIIRIQVDQGTANSCRITGFETTYSIA